MNKNGERMIDDNRGKRMISESVNNDAFILLAGLLICIAAGCSEQVPAEIPDHARDLENLAIYPAEETPEYEIRLTRDQTFGESDDVMFGNISSVAVDDLDRVFIADSRENTVTVFHRDGRYLYQVGRTGDGPGEARHTVRIFIWSDRLYIFDGPEGRVNVFTLPDGPETAEYSHTINYGGEDWNHVTDENDMPPSLYAVLANGSFLMNARTSPLAYRENPESTGVRRYFLLDPEGMVMTGPVIELDEPLHIVTEWFILPPPFVGRSLIAVSGDNLIFSAWTDDFLIRVHDLEGNYQRAFYRPVDGSPLTREDAVNSMDDHEQLHNAVRSMDIPETWPALRAMQIDDENRIWASTYLDDETDDFRVLSDSGELLAAFEWPGDKPLQEIKGGYLYTRETEEETGLPEIVRYRVEMLPNHD